MPKVQKGTKNGLLVMAKRPSPGHTKTRLTPHLSPEEAAILYECFLKDVVGKVADLTEISPFLAYAPNTAVAYFQSLAPTFGLIPQRGERLGDRLAFVMQRCQAEGMTQVVAMNSDSPTLPAAYLRESFAKLANPEVDVVLGPCEDGGYYLIGWKRPYPRLVREVQMSTPHVLTDTLALANGMNLRVALLPSWYDVDSAEELLRLRQELAEQPGLAPHTARFFNN